MGRRPDWFATATGREAGGPTRAERTPTDLTKPVPSSLVFGEESGMGRMPWREIGTDCQPNKFSDNPYGPQGSTGYLAPPPHLQKISAPPSLLIIR